MNHDYVEKIFSVDKLDIMLPNEFVNSTKNKEYIRFDLVRIFPKNSTEELVDISLHSIDLVTFNQENSVYIMTCNIDYQKIITIENTNLIYVYFFLKRRDQVLDITNYDFVIEMSLIYLLVFQYYLTHRLATKYFNS